MSFSTNGQVVLADATPANVTYSETQNTGTQCIYADRTREIGVPRTLTISHQEVGTGTAKRLRSMVKLSDVKESPSLEGDVAELKAHLVVDCPQRIVTATDVGHVIAQLIDLMNNATFIAQLLNREV